MSGRPGTAPRIGLCAVGILIGVSAAAAADKPKPAKDARAEFFGLNRLHQFHLDLTAENYKAMQPPEKTVRFPSSAPNPDAKPAGPAADFHRSAGFGIEFPWVRGGFTADGTAFENVGVRYKGNGSYLPSKDKLKRNMKLDLDHYHDGLKLAGMKSVNLNAGAIDPSRSREAVGYALYRLAGVPAARTAYAELTVTIPGKHDKSLVGLYTIVEPIDKPFLKHWFGSADGLLMKPEWLQGLEYLGDDWAKYPRKYLPKDDATPAQAARVIEFTRLVNKAPDDEFRAKIGDYLDVDEFLRYVAATALQSNVDNFFSTGHNCYIYLNPATNKFAFIPWDLDISFAAFPFLPIKKQMNLSIDRPYTGESKLVERLFADLAVREKYKAIVREVADAAFDKGELLRLIEAAETTVKEPLAREAAAEKKRKEGTEAAAGFRAAPDLKVFAARRTASVKAQLAGTSKGYTPAALTEFGPGLFFVAPVMGMADADKNGAISETEFAVAIAKLYRACDPDGREWTDADSFRKGLASLAPPGTGDGPAAFLTPGVFRRLDPEKTGRATAERFTATARTLFAEWDEDSSSSLDDEEIEGGLNGLIAIPRPAAPQKTEKGKP